MPKYTAHRKYQLTINNPLEHEFSHDIIKEKLNYFASVIYWCMCDEIGGESGTAHTHVYFISKNPIMFQTVQKHFYGTHIEPAYGKNLENRDYVRKDGEKWQIKKETNLPETFEESSELPPERQVANSISDEVYSMIKDGASNIEILEAFPSAMNRIPRIEETRQTLLSDKYKNTFRNLEVTYIWGATGVGKTRCVMEKYSYENVFRVTNNEHPFDLYKTQEIVIFEEFRSSIKIEDMLNYLDGYPIALKCRYLDKVACFSKVFIISNIELTEQYKIVQYEQVATWRAFLRRIHKVITYTDIGVYTEQTKQEYFNNKGAKYND